MLIPGFHGSAQAAHEGKIRRDGQPLNLDPKLNGVHRAEQQGAAQDPGGLGWPWQTALGFLALYGGLDLVLIWIILRLFNVRWRVAR